MNYLPDKLATLRKHYNYSQKYIARILNVDIVDYMAFENGREVLNHEQIVKLSKFYHINYIELFKNDDKVTLYKTDKLDTDKVNIDYFIPKKTIFSILKKAIINHKLFFGLSVGIISLLIVFSIVNMLLKRPIKNEIYNINSLSVSNRSVLYLNSEGVAKGSGDNSYSQLSNIPSEDVVKVLANDKYSVFLLRDGSLYICGELDEKSKTILSKKKNAIDIAMGDNHLLVLNSDGSITCVGNNDNKQCDIDNTQKIKRVFAGKNASVAINNNGTVVSSGEFLGRSSIAEYKNIKDIDFSESSIIFLKEDGTVDYNSNVNNKHYIESLKWENIVDVACGNDFFVGLDNYGNVFVASNNTNLKEAESLKDIKAIDAGDNYFIAFDGENIYGFGENRYNQFISSLSAVTKLNQVDNFDFKCFKNRIILSFEKVPNAFAYEITFNDKKIISKFNTNIGLDATDIDNFTKCSLTIKTIGDDYYEDSDEKLFIFNYSYNNKDNVELVDISSDLDSMSKNELEDYLRSLNITKIESKQSDEVCSDDKISVCDIEGIIPSGTYIKNDLKDLIVKFKYCKKTKGFE